MAKWICETCRHYPPSSCGGKSCSYCEPERPDSPFCYSERDDEEVIEESESRKYIRKEVIKQMD